MGKTATVDVIVDADDKSSAEEVLRQLGMPMSTLITILLKQVALTQSIPFDIALPKVPEAIDVSQMSPQELQDMMMQSYHAAETEDLVDASKFFEEFRKNHS